MFMIRRYKDMNYNTDTKIYVDKIDITVPFQKLLSGLDSGLHPHVTRPIKSQCTAQKGQYNQKERKKKILDT